MTDRKKNRHAKNNIPLIYSSGGIKIPRPLGGNVFQPIGIIFELVQDNIGMNLLTNFHEDRTTNVASSVFTSHILKNTPPLRSRVFKANVTIFELIQYIIETNLLTGFHED
ncbi:hypothetical protein DPMN_171883 [Dreissena polymorpha]|uniref:Uncharacterized protein n=1 Tax=Dreissena polymorpha TaxID=45954 RepID=A0A9D4E1Y6_DREPO|nr:hypothetical protein DPMN_171883 [Dreissena polymorpha]